MGTSHLSVVWFCSLTSTPLPDLFSVLKDICFSWPCYFWSHNILPPNPVRSPEGLLFPFPFLIVVSFSLTCFGQHFYSSVFQIWLPDPVGCINHTTFWQLIDLLENGHREREVIHASWRWTSRALQVCFRIASSVLIGTHKKVNIYMNLQSFSVPLERHCMNGLPFEISDNYQFSMSGTRLL